MNEKGSLSDGILVIGFCLILIGAFFVFLIPPIGILLLLIGVPMFIIGLIDTFIKLFK